MPKLLSVKDVYMLLYFLLDQFCRVVGWVVIEGFNLFPLGSYLLLKGFKVMFCGLEELAVGS